MYPYNCKFRVTSPFGNRTLNGSTEFHKGIDLVGTTDKYISAAVGGEVVSSTIVTDKSNLTWQWGNYVRIDGDDGRRYYYCHMSKRLVNVGQRVEAGDHIGVEGTTGYSTGSHLHFEVRDSTGTSINPAPIIGIANSVGTYGDDYRSVCAAKYGLSEGTLAYLDKYQYAAALYRKLAEG